MGEAGRVVGSLLLKKSFFHSHGKIHMNVVPRNTMNTNGETEN